MATGKRLTTFFLVGWFTVSMTSLLLDAMRAIDGAVRVVGKTEARR